MENLADQSAVELAKGQTVRLQDARKVRMSVRAGLVWVTMEGERTDHFVGAGETLCIDAAGLTLISAMQGSALEFDFRSETLSQAAKSHDSRSLERSASPC